MSRRTNKEIVLAAFPNAIAVKSPNQYGSYKWKILAGDEYLCGSAAFGLSSAAEAWKYAYWNVQNRAADREASVNMTGVRLMDNEPEDRIIHGHNADGSEQDVTICGKCGYTKEPNCECTEDQQTGSQG